MAVRSAVVQIVIQAKNATKAVFSGLKAQLGAFRNTVASMFSGLAGGIAGFVSGAAVTKVLRDITEKTAATEQSMLRLEGVLKATGNAAGLTAAQLNELAQTMQETRLIDDDQARDAISILATFRRVSGDTFTEAIKLAQDMSAVMGTDLNSSILQVGKALNDPILGVTALRRVGVQLTASQEALVKSMVETNNIAGAQKIILGELANEFGGAGEAEAKGLAGSIYRAQAAYDDFLKSIGQNPEIGGTLGKFFDAWESFWKSRELADPLGALQIDLDKVETKIEQLRRQLADNRESGIRSFTKRERAAKEDELRLLEAGANGLREEIRLTNERNKAAEDKATADAAAAQAAQDAADAEARRAEQVKAAAKALAEHNALVLEAIQYGSTHLDALLELTSEERRLTAELDRGNLSLQQRVAIEQRLADIRAATGIDSTPTVVGGGPIPLRPIPGVGQDVSGNGYLSDIADQAAKAAAQMQHLNDMADIFAQSWGAAWQAFGEGSISAGEAMLQSMRGALAGIAMSEAQLALLQGAKQIALGIGAFGTPAAAKHFASAAKLFAVGAGLAALGGLLGGGGGGGGRGGSGGSSGSTASDSNSYRNRDQSAGVIVVQGGLLDMNDPRQAEALTDAINRLGRQQRIEIRGR